MNKKLLSLAVAAALAAPASVALADATLYGKLHVSLDYADITDGYTGWGMGGEQSIPGSNRASRVGVKGSEDLGNGLKAIYQIEFGVNIVDTNDNLTSQSGVSMRNSFVGLAGDWGTILAGRHDTPLKISTGKLDLFGDTMADMNGTIGFDDERVDNAIAYISPNFSGFQLMAATVVGGGSTAIGSENEYADSIAEGYSLAGIYSNGPFYASVAYESFDSNILMSGTTQDSGAGTSGYVDNDYTKWRVGLGLLDWNGFTLTGMYESENDSPLAVDGYIVDVDMWQIQAGYSFGNNMVKAMYGQGERDSDVSVIDDSDYSAWAIGIDHNFSKRTKVYALYTARDDDLGGNFTYNGTSYSNGTFGDLGLDWDGFSLGIIHSF